MPTLPSGISAYVKVAGAKAEEYNPQFAEVARKASAYIESQVGAEFSVTLRNTEQLIGLRSLIDGVEQRRKIVEPGQSCKVYGRRVAGGQLRPFMFTKIQLTDDDTIACSKESVIKGLGSIVLELRRARGKKFLSDLKTYEDAPQQHTFHEASKKAAIGENVGFGAARSTKSSRHIKTDYIDPLSGPPWSTITFHYRNADLLEAQGHKPTSVRASQPHAVRSSGRVGRSDEAFGSGSNAEQEIQRLQAENESLRKRMKVEENTEEPVVKKEEESQQAVAPPKQKKSEVIDLTLSDED